MYLSQALNLAKKRPLIVPRGRNTLSRFVAVLSNNTQTFVGRNSYKTHPLQLRYSEFPHLHAEISCLIQACNHHTSILGVRRNYNPRDFDFSDYSISVARVLADGSSGLAKPCEYCQKALSDFKISNVEWTI